MKQELDGERMHAVKLNSDRTVRDIFISFIGKFNVTMIYAL